MTTQNAFIYVAVKESRGILSQRVLLLSKMFNTYIYHYVKTIIQFIEKAVLVKKRVRDPTQALHTAGQSLSYDYILSPR